MAICRRAYCRAFTLAPTFVENILIILKPNRLNVKLYRINILYTWFHPQNYQQLVTSLFLKAVVQTLLDDILDIIIHLYKQALRLKVFSDKIIFIQFCVLDGHIFNPSFGRFLP